jgi:hypothetical protein
VVVVLTWGSGIHWGDLTYLVIMGRTWPKRSLESRVKVNQELLSLCYPAPDLYMIRSAPLLRQWVRLFH